MGKKTTAATRTCQQYATTQMIKGAKIKCKLFLEAGDEHVTSEFILTKSRYRVTTRM